MSLSNFESFNLNSNLIPSRNEANTFKICRQNDRNVSACVKDSIEFLRPYLRSGDLGGGFKVDSIDPISIDDFIVDKSGIYAHVTNLKAFGAGNFIIDRFKVDIPNARIDALVTVPKIEANGIYKVNIGGRSLLNVQSTGKVRNILPNLKVRISFRGGIDSRNGEQYLRFDTCNVIVKVTGIKIFMDNLFPNEPILNQAANGIINQNTDLFVPELEISLKNSLCKR